VRLQAKPQSTPYGSSIGDASEVLQLGENNTRVLKTTRILGV
jgi:hypothetical protein